MRREKMSATVRGENRFGVLTIQHPRWRYAKHAELSGEFA
jgi:hypothetical protein